MKILGIDPGTSRIGFGFISDQPLTLITYGTIEIKEKSNKKFLLLSERMDELIEELRPNAAAIEKIYFVKNQKTAIEVAQARGIIMLSILKKGIPVSEYGPQEIKRSVTNYGLADKKSVAKLVGKLLNINDLKGYDDASDALAIAITAANLLRYEKLNRG